MPARILTLITFWLAVLSSAATAGGWLREEGTGFLSLSGVASDSGNLDGAAYLEYGLRPDLTVGAQIDAEMPSGLPQKGIARIFVRRSLPLTDPDGPHRLAYEISLGAKNDLLRVDAFAALGLGYGRGLTFAGHPGWLAVDLRGDLSARRAARELKVDATIGLSLTDRSSAMVQVFFSRLDGASATTLAPAFIFSPRRGKTRWLIGLESTGGDVGVKFGLWRDF